MGSSRPLGQAVDKLARAQGLVRTVTAAPENQKPNSLDYISVGNVAALNKPPPSTGWDWIGGLVVPLTSLAAANVTLGGRSIQTRWGRRFKGVIRQSEAAGQQLHTPTRGSSRLTNATGRSKGPLKHAFAKNGSIPIFPWPPYRPERETAYKNWRNERNQFQKRYETEQESGQPTRRRYAAKKEMRYARFAAGQEAEAERVAQMLSRYAWAKENGMAADAASYASHFDEGLYQQMRTRLDKFDDRFAWEQPSSQR